MIKRILRKGLLEWLSGYSSPELAMGAVTWSQFGEDRLITTLFERGFTGTFVDVGAFHPIYLSNTYNLYLKGWQGWAIDPNPEMQGLFARLRPKDKFIQSAVGSQAGSVTRSLFDEGTFNCLNEHMDSVPEKYRKGARTLTVPSRPLAAILSDHKVERMDFLNVDCEGADLDILQSNDWKRWKPRVVCVEDHAEEWQSSDIVRCMGSYDYSLKYRAGLTSIFALRDRPMETGAGALS
jgi:FkbM family methyltransferase